MKYKIIKENKPTLATFGKYKATAVHHNTVETRQLLEETALRCGISVGVLTTVMTDLSNVINDHLRQGDRVRLDRWGLMKLEIESDKVDDPEDFNPRKHIRGVRLHFIPESSGGSPELYKGIRYERQRCTKE